MPVEHYKTLGFDKLNKKLLALDTDLAWKALRQAGRETMKPVRDEIRAGANFDKDSEGKHMRDSISIRIRKGSRKSRQRAATIKVGPTGPHAHKALAQEFGTKRQKAEPFIKKSFAKKRHSLLTNLHRFMKRRVDNAMKK